MNWFSLMGCKDKELRKEQGFTLIELLVVILIIGILAAIAIPAYMNQRKRAVTATLVSDLQSVALSYESWSMKPENTNKKFVESAGGVSSHIAHDLAEKGVHMTSDWNSIEGDSKSKVSTATYANIVVIPSANATWKRAHEENEFCIGGSNVGSDYDFVSNVGMGAINYHRTLYYDKMGGGVRTAQELADQMLAGEMVSCDGQISLWLKEQGVDTSDYWAKYATKK